MKGTIKAVSPRLKDGQQRNSGEGERKVFYFDVTITGEDGKEMKGEVGGKTEGSYRFSPGDVVEYTAEQTQYGWKFKFDKPKDQQTGNGPTGGRSSYQSQSSGNWSPQKENSVMIQGLLKSVIESGMASEHWSKAVRKALTLHDEVLAERIPAPAAAPTPSAGPAAPVTTSKGLTYHKDGAPDGPPVAQGERVVPGHGIGDDLSDTPF